MKLTCVTAVFNAIKAGNRERLIRCVESVAKLKTEHEHLIYDGASTDGTVELLRELEKKTPGLKVVSEPDTGIYNALNKGVRDAAGEWFYVLGCDDYICKPEVMDELIGVATRKIDVIAAMVERDRKDVYPFMRSLNDLSTIFTGTPVCHQGEVMRTHIVREFGGFDEHYSIAADANLLLKAHLEGKRFWYVFRAFANYGCGGLSERMMKKSRDEFFDCVQRNLLLSDAQLVELRSYGLFSYWMVVRYLFHGDFAIRKSALTMFKRKVNALRIVKLMRYILFSC